MQRSKNHKILLTNSSKHPYISNGFGWTSYDKKMKLGKLEIKVKTAYLPDGEDDKTCLHVGVMEDSKEIISVHIWVSKHKTEIVYSMQGVTCPFN